MDLIDMIVAASNWWEPGTADLFDVGDAAAILLFITAFVGAMAGLGRVFLKRLHVMIKAEIQEATALIHPEANGGVSLPDVARKVNTLIDDFIEYKEDVKESKAAVAEAKEIATGVHTMLTDYIEKHTKEEANAVESRDILVDYVIRRIAMEDESSKE